MLSLLESRKDVVGSQMVGCCSRNYYVANLSFPRVLEWSAGLRSCLSPLTLNIRSKIGVR